ncbi:MAG: sulfurtransferase [Rhodospirillales bacterium CG15_BIG_FIL_POST_REV_8_21_14_020_66_15]|nr:MAG: sulfurtransferase [Rhodospirillales bacterium CG15_BIG_FIL_POST_REV_8_21_14_020_66_15]
MSDGYAGDITPKEAWEMLRKDPKAVLVDVRTHAEWAYVGLPDLSDLGKELKMISWVLFPTGEINTEFTDDLDDQVPDKDATVLFLCRSGVRSIAAAKAATQAGYARSYNVLTGFEGDKDAGQHRGTVGGWKVDGLPWVQK